MSHQHDPDAPRLIGRYALHRQIAAGGTASVHLGRLLGAEGFTRTVAIKRLHSGFASDPTFVKMFLDEARLAARVRHPNVVPVLDVVSLEGEVFLVMEYVQGESLSRLIKANKNKPLQASVAVSLMTGALYGLHAAHDATNERGEPLMMVHRDVSPQNILVGIDGIARVTDFGIAKAVNRLQTTQEGQLKGKLPYMSPEMLRSKGVDRRTDVYAASVVLWEALTGRRLFDGSGPAATAQAVLEAPVEPPSKLNSQVPSVLDEIVLRGLSRDPDARFATARDMALELERAVVRAPGALVSQWVERVAKPTLDERARWIYEVESFSLPDAPPAADATARNRTVTPPGAPTVPPSLRTSGTDFQVTLAPHLLNPRRSRVRAVAGVFVATVVLAAAGLGGFAIYRAKTQQTNQPAETAVAEPASIAPPPPPATPPPTPDPAPAPPPPPQPEPDTTAAEAAAPPSAPTETKRATKSAPAKPAAPTGKPATKPANPKSGGDGFGDLTRF